MIAILQKYRMIFIMLAVLVLVAVIWIFILKQNDSDIPMRGTFVMKGCIYDRAM